MMTFKSDTLPDNNVHHNNGTVLYIINDFNHSYTQSEHAQILELFLMTKPGVKPRTFSTNSHSTHKANALPMSHVPILKISTFIY